MSAEYSPEDETDSDLNLLSLIYDALHEQTDVPPRLMRLNQTLFFTGMNGDYQGEGHSWVAGKVSFTAGLLRKVVATVTASEENDDFLEHCESILYIRKKSSTTARYDKSEPEPSFEVRSTVCATTKMKNLANFIVAEAAYDSWSETSGWRDLTPADISSVESVLDQADRWKNVSILNLLSVYNQLRVI